MSEPTASQRFPRAPLLGALALVTLAITAAGLGRITGAAAPQPTTAASMVREFRVADRADGAVMVYDARDGHEIEAATGQNGFLRGILRSLARERRMAGIGPQAPFRLTAWRDGRLTLDDLATGGRVELEAFGPANTAVFAHLLTVEGSRS